MKEEGEDPARGEGGATRRAKQGTTELVGLALLAVSSTGSEATRAVSCCKYLARRFPADCYTPVEAVVPLALDELL